MPSVHCVIRSRTKLMRMRGENCIEASVSVISRMANTIDTTVMIEAAMPARMTCATCGSDRDGNRTCGTQAFSVGNASSAAENNAPAAPSRMAIASGRTRKPPRSAYSEARTNCAARRWYCCDCGK